MLQIFAALALIALGMGVDAYYQRRIRIAECDAYETGYHQGKTEEHIRCAERAKHADGKQAAVVVLDDAIEQKPSMAAPVEMPPTFEERMRKHGRAVVKLK